MALQPDRELRGLCRAALDGFDDAEEATAVIDELVEQLGAWRARILEDREKASAIAIAKARAQFRPRG